MSYDLYPAVDEDLKFAPEVRAANAATPEFRSQVVPLTQTQRNNLTGDELWDNRLIFNTTTDRIDRYDEGSTTWIQVTTEPAGIIKEYGGDTAPAYHVMADGGLLSRTGIYANLFSVFGTKYNIGSGGEDGTNFRLPNRKGKIAVGLDVSQTEFNALGKTGGEKTHVLSGAEMPVHTHTNSTNSLSPEGPENFYDATGGSVIHRDIYAVSGEAGGGAAHNNLQPFITMNFIITL
jgi:microcystin-dependent protein